MAGLGLSKSFDEYSVGWIAALPHERAAGIAMLDEEHPRPSDFRQPSTDKNSYTWGRIGEHNLVIASLPAGAYGTISASTTASQMLSSFPQITFCLLVGIGAGVSSRERDIRLGDVVVSQPDGKNGGVVQYDFKAVRSNKVYERRGTLNAPPEALLKAMANIKADHELRPSRVQEFLEDAVKHFPRLKAQYRHQGMENDHLFQAAYEHVDSYDSTCCNCDITRLINRPPRTSTTPVIHYGLVASGNTLFKHATERDELVKSLKEDGDGNCICLEMEAAGLMNSFPCLVIKGICDYGDSHKNDRWQRYAAATAAAYAKEFLAYVPPLDIATSAKIVEILERDRKVVAFLRALYTCPYSERKDRNIKSLTGTCEWFTDHQLFRQWNDAEGLSMLWVSGDPGCGKSVLARHLIDDVLAGKENATLLYFFFKDDFPDQRTSSDAICALLRQILLAKPLLLQDTTLDRFQKGGEMFLKTFNELWKTFSSIIVDSEAGEIICVIDALDECENSEEFLKQLGELNTILAKQSKLKFLVTSRPYDFIRRGFQWVKDRVPVIHLSGEAENEVAKISHEINLVIRERVGEISAEKNLEPAETNYLIDQITKIPNRTYLWVHLVLDVIRNTAGFVRGNVHKVLKQPPKTVNDAYEKILGRSQNPDKTRRLLQIIIAATRPLNLDEMSIALETEELQQPYELILEPESRFRISIRDLCGLFVTVVDSKIYFLHQTAREFLLRDSTILKNDNFVWQNSIDLVESHRVLAEICIWYLGYDRGFGRHSSTMLSALRLYLPPMPIFCFLPYSTTFWTTHLSEAHVHSQEDITVAALALLHKDSIKREMWSTIRQSYDEGYRDSQDNSPLLLASRFGIAGLVEKLLEEPRYKSNFHQILRRHISLLAVVKILSQLFHLAALRYGIIGLIEEFVEADFEYNPIKDGCQIQLKIHWWKFYWRRINWQNFHLWRFLWRRFLGGHWKSHEDINRENAEGELPLGLAIDHNHTETVKTLLENGANPNGIHKADGEYGKRPLPVLLLAIWRRNREIVTLLIEYGAYVKDESSWETPLVFAVQAGNPSIVQVLLDYGAPVDGRDGYRNTPLLTAIARLDYTICETLLEYNANTEAYQHKSGRTPLICAMAGGFQLGVKLLVEFGANVNSSDVDGVTPLMLAAQAGNIEVAQFLMRNGANINASDKYNRTALMFAAKLGYFPNLRLYIDNGADIYNEDKFGITPVILVYTKAGAAAVQLDLPGRIILGAEGEEIRRKLIFHNGGREAVMKAMELELNDEAQDMIWDAYKEMDDWVVFYGITDKE